MAIDPEKYEEFRNQLDDLVKKIPIEETQEYVQKEVVDPSFKEVEDLIDESRPPRVYIFGRSGAGKSSLINALAEKKVAEVGTVEPTTVESNLHEIDFPKDYSSWEVVDSRGLFESVSPDGTVPEDTEALMKEDLKQYQPDILIHVITPDQVRAGEQDFEVIEELREEFGDLFPPILYCLNKVDSHQSPNGDWPPEENDSLEQDIFENLNFMTELIDTGGNRKPFNTPFGDDKPVYGYEFESDNNLGAIPVCLEEDSIWNVDRLRWVIGDFLPDDARLQFAQANRQEMLMRRIAQHKTDQFSSVAASIGGAPTPVADILPLCSMQLLLVGIIGGLSCRDIEVDTVNEYLAAAAGVTVGGMVARQTARSLGQFIPGAGQAVSASVAAGGTWAIGKSAEKYYFDGDSVDPSELMSEGEGKHKTQ